MSARACFDCADYLYLNFSDEAWEQVHKFEKAGNKDKEVRDSVAHYAMKHQGSLLDEPWSGTEDSERTAYVQEEL